MAVEKRRAVSKTNGRALSRRDIAPTGVQCVEIDGTVTGAAVSAVERWLADSDSATAAVDVNYRIGEQHFSYRAVREIFGAALDSVVHLS